jgi:abortive infection bacteriophage resistance protein
MSVIKSFKNYQEQIEILQKRGMIISDEDKDYALDKLSQISYYRLNGFWRPCRKSEGTYKSFEYITKYESVIYK